MGAQSFREEVWGESAAKAFDSAVARAKYLHGHGGYTGTIAEKSDFRLFHPPHGMQAETFITYIERNCTATGATHWPKSDAIAVCSPGQCVAPV